MRRAVVTGWAVMSPLGCERDQFATALFAGRSAAARIEAFDPSGFECQIAAEVRDAPPPPPGLPAADRRTALGVVACRDALSHAGLERAPEATAGRWAVSLGTGLSSVVPEEIESDTLPFVDEAGVFDHAAFAARALDDVRGSARHATDAVADWVRDATGAMGPAAMHFSACAAGAQGIGQAVRWVRRGAADVVVCGGMDSMIHPFGVASFMLLGALTTDDGPPAGANRPFHRDRGGFLIGEGAAALVVEDYEHAKARGAQIHAEVLGYGSSVDAYNVTAPHPEGLGARLAIGRCLRDARVDASAVGYINAHGTGTSLNDPIEALAIRTALGAYGESVPVSSTKAAHGHLVAAAGALEACVSMVALREQTLPPTLNLDDPDPACALSHVPMQARKGRIEVALSNSFGFGGQNAVLAFARPPRS